MSFTCVTAMGFSVCFILLNTLLIATEGGHRFGYTPWEQKKWREQHSSCGGHLQSPIKINSHQAIPLRMPALEMIHYHDLLPGPIELTNNGHSVSLSIPKLSKDDPNSKFIPYVFGGRLNNEYELEGLHFHWGERNNMGSEHVFNDVRFPLEMHIIHRNRKYQNVPEALKYRDGLTVLAFFYQLNERENTQLSQIMHALPHVEEFNASIKLNESFPLSSLLPPAEDLDRFYTYLGSLTTPPCSEAVTWIIFPNPLPVSVIQMSKFRSLQAGDRASMLLNNYRSIQRIGRRRVFVRMLRPRGWLYNSTVLYSKWDWLQ